MIKSFRHKGLKKLFEQGDRSGLRGDQVEKIENILALLSVADAVNELRLPALKLHPLRGDLKASGR